MTRKLLPILFFMMATTVMAQNTALTPVDAAFSKAEIDQFSADEIEEMNFLAQAGFYIAKDGKVPPIATAAGNFYNKLSGESLESAGHSNFNPLLYGIVPLPNEQSYIAFEDGTVIMIFSGDRLKILLDRQRINQQATHKK